MSEFVWDEECNPEIFQYGSIIMMVDGKTAFSIQRMVERLSNESDVFLDWHYAGGRGILKCEKKDVEKINQYIDTLSEEYFAEYIHSKVRYE